MSAQMLLDFFKSHIRQPKFQLGITLTLIFLSAIIYRQSLDSFVMLCIALIATVGSDLIFLKLRKKNIFFPSAALVTGFIIALLTDPNLLWYNISAIGIVAMASKHFLRFSGRHVFNPAAFGLFLSSLLFNQNISWWAVSFQQFNISHFSFIIYFIILLSPAVISVLRMRRFRIIISFLFVYGLFIGLNSKFFLDPTILFFSLVMLPEPMTTPNNHTRQVLFGTTVALLVIILSLPILNSKFLILNSFDPLAFSLLIGNLLFFRFR